MVAVASVGQRLDACAALLADKTRVLLSPVHARTPSLVFWSAPRTQCYVAPPLRARFPGLTDAVPRSPSATDDYFRFLLHRTALAASFRALRSSCESAPRPISPTAHRSRFSAAGAGPRRTPPLCSGSSDRFVSAPVARAPPPPKIGRA